MEPYQPYTPVTSRDPQNKTILRKTTGDPDRKALKWPLSSLLLLYRTHQNNTNIVHHCQNRLIAMVRLHGFSSAPQWGIAPSFSSSAMGHRTVFLQLRTGAREPHPPGPHWSKRTPSTIPALAGTKVLQELSTTFSIEHQQHTHH